MAGKRGRRLDYKEGLKHNFKQGETKNKMYRYYEIEPMKIFDLKFN